MNLRISLSHEVIYLACPFSHNDPYTEKYRVLHVTHMAGQLMRRGYIVFSPLTHSEPIAELFPELRHDHEFWMDQNKPFIIASSQMFIDALPGWDDSLGVSDEIIISRDHDKSVWLVNNDLNATELKDE